jgi:hypothetical protein
MPVCDLCNTHCYHGYYSNVPIFITISVMGDRIGESDCLGLEPVQKIKLILQTFLSKMKLSYLHVSAIIISGRNTAWRTKGLLLRIML